MMSECAELFSGLILFELKRKNNLPVFFHINQSPVFIHGLVKGFFQTANM